MTQSKISMMVVACLALGALAGCGDDNTKLNNEAPPATALGGFNMNCGGTAGTQTGGQQKQIPFQQQQQCVQQQQNDPTQQKQEFKFVNSKVADFDVRLDCDARLVYVKFKGKDQKEQNLPIASDGSIGGTLRFKQEVADDGKGTGQCWLEYIVSFTGKAACDAPAPQPSASPTPFQKTLELNTEVQFDPTTLDALKAAGVIDDNATTGPSPSPSVSTTPSPSPSPSPSVSVTPSPSPSATVSPTPTPAPSPSISVRPVQVCKVEDPCPIESKTDLSCGQ